MQILIHFDIVHSYAQEVSFSPHIFRLFPKSDRFVSLRSAQFQTNEGASVQYRRDLFDNEVASCFFPHSSDQLRAHMELELQITERNAFDFLLASHALHFPLPTSPRKPGCWLLIGKSPGPLSSLSGNPALTRSRLSRS